MRSVAVIGKNFGDEGKGLVTASLCFSAQKPLVIRNNGGGQSGHTVENEQTGARFIHHQIGSGAEYGAATLWAEEFRPDLYQISKELKEFNDVFGFIPQIYSLNETKITLIDDVIINMALETQRGKARHGSCAMGINECCKRNSAGFSLTVGEVKELSLKQLKNRLKAIRNNYSHKRAIQLGIDSDNPYCEMLYDGNLLNNYAEEINKNAEFISIVDADSLWLSQFELLVFETGQGLLLDKDYKEYAPHLTSSKTGVSGAFSFLKKRNLSLDEAIYVTRPYVTRHGAGPLPCECLKEEFKNVESDETNQANPWQGEIRYARHTDVESFLSELLRDVKEAGITPCIAVTHLNETDETIYFQNSNMQLSELISLIKPNFYRIYGSYDRQNITVII